jgi:hypothetical protein
MIKPDYGMKTAEWYRYAAKVRQQRFESLVCMYAYTLFGDF